MTEYGTPSWSICVQATLEAFQHRDWIRRFARDAGFTEPRFTDGLDDTHHPAFWQSLAVLEKPA